MKPAKPAAGEAVPAPTLGDLEAPIFEAVRFASILYQLLEDAIGESQESITGHRNRYYLDDDKVDDIMFIAGKAAASTARVGKILLEVL